MASETKKQQQTVERVTPAFEQYELGSGSGDLVRTRKQAIAVALREAGAKRAKPMPQPLLPSGSKIP